MVQIPMQIVTSSEQSVFDMVYPVDGGGLNHKWAATRHTDRNSRDYCQNCGGLKGKLVTLKRGFSLCSVYVKTVAASLNDPRGFGALRHGTDRRTSAHTGLTYFCH
jgi:hypothetical protein